MARALLISVICFALFGLGSQAHHPHHNDDQEGHGKWRGDDRAHVVMIGVPIPIFLQQQEANPKEKPNENFDKEVTGQAHYGHQIMPYPFHFMVPQHHSGLSTTVETSKHHPKPHFGVIGYQTYNFDHTHHFLWPSFPGKNSESHHKGAGIDHVLPAHESPAVMKYVWPYRHHFRESLDNSRTHGTPSTTETAYPTQSTTAQVEIQRPQVPGNTDVEEERHRVASIAKPTEDSTTESVQDQKQESHGEKAVDVPSDLETQEKKEPTKRAKRSEKTKTIIIEEDVEEAMEKLEGETLLGLLDSMAEEYLLRAGPGEKKPLRDTFESLRSSVLEVEEKEKFRKEQARGKRGSRSKSFLYDEEIDYPEDYYPEEEDYEYYGDEPGDPDYSPSFLELVSLADQHKKARNAKPPK